MNIGEIVLIVINDCILVSGLAPMYMDQVHVLQLQHQHQHSLAQLIPYQLDMAKSPQISPHQFRIINTK